MVAVNDSSPQMNSQSKSVRFSEGQQLLDALSVVVAVLRGSVGIATCK